MYINTVAHYLPEKVVPNSYFEAKNGLTDEWISTRTGIKNRRIVSEGENTNTMAVEVATSLFEKNPSAKDKIDLIIGVSYTPHDTVGTIAHRLQQKFNISAQAIYVSSACSSFINAIEIAEGYFATNKAKTVLIIASEHNAAYNDDSNEISGHLWGDGASGIILSKEKQSEQDLEIIDVYTQGLGNVGKGPDGVYLRPAEDGLIMPFGKDVYIYACKYMYEAAIKILSDNNLTTEDVDLLIPHQANIRIINNVRDQLGLKPEQVIVNIDQLGNTGCASTMIGLSQNLDKFKKGNTLVVSVFGGGYSAGSMLLKA